MRLKAMVFTLGLGVAACAAPPAPPPSVKAPPPRPQASRPPQPPVGVDPSYELPAKDSDGRFLTPNVGLGPLETMFNVRSALNVAALSCVTSTNTAPRDGYNRFLKLHKTVLANANKAIDAKYRREHGSAGIRVRDSRMTKLYNHYAYPPVKGAFCAKTARYPHRRERHGFKGPRNLVTRRPRGHRTGFPGSLPPHRGVPDRTAGLAAKAAGSLRVAVVRSFRRGRSSRAR